MAPTPEPEILRPRMRAGSELFSDRNLDLLSHVLDDFLRIPGTQIRFGLDGIIGLIPGVGDIIGAMASWIIILAAWLRGVPRVTLARMLANVAIETIVGTIPLLGDAFDVAWKANRKNFALLERSMGAVPNYTADPAYGTGFGAGAGSVPAQGRLGTTPQQQKKHRFSDWMFLFWLFFGMLCLLAIPLALLAFLAGKFFAMGAHR
ncbi:hypothetical protein Terro_0435 [Terriglobus roseus DSM 18391]|uniref:DUF4112 domain-containing protein n=1 Tax=Terriglobus roseus (strain DSM 18391 / NRRL B-41598 / KBS 63) TaxID=926566 RepID=I3ZC12_TERRK|nr:DUF4112 domain-containing protein [Terriglobus roseus]AFL86780.1 hypothetical protein Terro_0435 [Terriglobus roseus DSM 18391]